MPRIKRQTSTTNTYHVVIKGADRQLLFEESKDYRKYLELLDYFKQECQYEVFAYCLMSNHVHLLIRHSDDIPLETIFRRINTTYAVWYNFPEHPIPGAAFMNIKSKVAHLQTRVSFFPFFQIMSLSFEFMKTMI